MSSLIQFTPLSGALSHEPLSYSLEIDDATLLLDCGWTECTLPIYDIPSQIDAILISHSTVEHIGALVYIYKKYDLACPIYSTIPVQIMGQIIITDCMMSIKQKHEWDLYSLDDIEHVFDKIIVVKYSQPMSLTGKCNGIVITPYPAGHTVGGCLWKIKKDTDDILYAPVFNHKKERHLSASPIHLGLDVFTRPSLLITDAYNIMTVSGNKKTRDVLFIETIVNTLRNEGIVLIPVNTTRVLELAYLLDQHWQYSHSAFPIYLLTQTGKSLEVAKNMLEWFGDSIMSAFSTRREVPFDLKHVIVVTKMQEMNPGPKVILCSSDTLESGHSYNLIYEIAQHKENVIILPERKSSGLASELYQIWKDSAKSEGEIINLDLDLFTDYETKIPMEGEELKKYMAAQKETRNKEVANDALLKRLQEQEIESDDEEMDVTNPLHDTYDVYMKDDSKLVGYFKQSWSFKMFPVLDMRKKYDDYGEALSYDMFDKGEYENALKTAMSVNHVQEIVKIIDIPGTYSNEERSLSLKCSLVYFDYEGRSDGVSVKNIITQISPRKVIIIHGDKESTNELHSHLAAASIEVYSPKVGETMNVSHARNRYLINLSDSLLNSLRFVNNGDYNITYIHGTIHSNVLEPVLDVHTPLLLGDVKLSNFRKSLVLNGYQTEFSGGILYLPKEAIIIRKNGKGQISFNAKYGRHIRKIRELLYKELVIL